MSGKDVEDCTKKTVIIEKENYYLLVGDDFAMVTVPRENDPMMSTTRMIAEIICSEITDLMQKRIALQEAPAQLHRRKQYEQRSRSSTRHVVSGGRRGPDRLIVYPVD